MSDSLLSEKRRGPSPVGALTRGAKKRKAYSNVFMSTDILPLLVGYFQRKEMRNLALVSRRWKKTVTAHLQANKFLVVPLEDAELTPGELYENNRIRTWLYFLQSGECGQMTTSPTGLSVVGELCRMDGYVYAVEMMQAGRYDPIDDVWVVLPSPTHERNEFGLVPLEGKIYAVGGKNSGRSVEMYDPALGSWAPCPDLSTYRSMCDAAALDGYIYAVGGHSGREGVLASVERWCPGQDDHWEHVASLSSRRYDCKVCSVGHKLYVFGGISAGIDVFPFSPISSCEVYCPKADTWTQVTTMPTLRVGFSVEVVDHIIYVTGGETHTGTASYSEGQATNLIEVYDTETGTWSTAVPMSKELVSV